MNEFEDLKTCSNMEGENMDGNSSYKWHASRLELDWEVSLQ